MELVGRWRNALLAQRQSSITNLEAALPNSADDPLQLVRAPEPWGVYASHGPNFQHTVFGRDSIEVAEDVLATHPELARDIILTLCHLQGSKTNPITEEEPGKIHHEYRALRIGNDATPRSSLDIMHDLQAKWGRQDTGQMIYYGSFDATPLLVRLVERYAAQQGTGILDEIVERLSDQRTLRVHDCLEHALNWLEGKITDRTHGLFAYQRINSNGIHNQAWKDSDTSYLHTDGSLPAPDAAIASIELQGYAYDALLAASRLGLGSAVERARWQSTATHLQQQAVTLLWMEDEQYFAQGLDLKNPAAPRQIATITSNPAALLDSDLVHDLPPDQAEQYAQAVAHTVFSDELLTDVGVRCRAVKHRSLLDAIDYHGSNAVWPKETYDIAKGLRRAGLPALADDLELRLLHGLERAGEYAEFMYVSLDGTVWYDSAEAVRHFAAQSLSRPPVTPEPAQAWTISAALGISKRLSSQPAAATATLNRNVLKAT